MKQFIEETDKSLLLSFYQQFNCSKFTVSMCQIYLSPVVGILDWDFCPPRSLCGQSVRGGVKRNIFQSSVWKHRSLFIEMPHNLLVFGGDFKNITKYQKMCGVMSAAWDRQSQKISINSSIKSLIMGGKKSKLVC